MLLFKIKKTTCLLLLLLNCAYLYADKTISVTVKIKNNTHEKIRICSFYGLTTIPIDSICNLKKGEDVLVNFTLAYNRGFYRINDGNSLNEFDFILDNFQNLSFEFDSLFSFQTLLKSKDKINSDYTKIQLLSKKTNKTLRILNDKIKSIKNKDSLILFENNKTNIIGEYKANIEKIRNNNKGNLLATSSSVLVEPEFNMKDTLYADKRSFLSDHFFDAFPFTEEALVRSTLLPNAYARYFERYVDYDEPGFKKAIEIILTKAKTSPQVYEFTLTYLMNLFDKAGPQIIFDFLIENYWDKNSCNENNITQINDILKLQPGNTFPDTMVVIDNKLISISDISNKKDLSIVVFWSANCPHCLTEMKILNNIQLKFKNSINVIAIHIDEDTVALKKYIAEYNYTYYHVFENKGWEGTLAQKYRVNKTPTIYLISKSKIVARNIYSDDLITFVSNYLK